MLATSHNTHISLILIPLFQFLGTGNSVGNFVGLPFEAQPFLLLLLLVVVVIDFNKTWNVLTKSRKTLLTSYLLKIRSTVVNLLHTDGQA